MQVVLCAQFYEYIPNVKKTVGFFHLMFQTEFPNVWQVILKILGQTTKVKGLKGRSILYDMVIIS